MGWLIGWSDRKSLVKHLCEDNGVKTIKRFFSGNHMWTVQENNGHKFICLYLLTGGRNQDWGYKPVEESMGPYEDTCPLSFFDMVECPTDGYAAEFRERCKAAHARKNQRIFVGDGVLLTNGRCYKVTSNERGRIKAYGADVNPEGVVRIPRKMLVRVIPQLNPVDVIRECAIQTEPNSPEWNTLVNAAKHLAPNTIAFMAFIK